MLTIKKAILTAVLATGTMGMASAADPSFVPPSPFGSPTVPPPLFGGATKPAAPFGGTTPPAAPFGGSVKPSAPFGGGITPSTPVATAPVGVTDEDLIRILKELGVTGKTFHDKSMDQPGVLFEMPYGQNRWKMALKRIGKENLVTLSISFQAQGTDGQPISPGKMDPRIVAKLLGLFSGYGYLTTPEFPSFVTYDGASSFAIVTPLPGTGVTAEKLKKAIDKQLQAVQGQLLPVLNEIRTAAEGSGAAVQ